MGAGLYDAAFATLRTIYCQPARSAITTLTLYGGFASTVCWLLSAFLVERSGWRSACFVYAGIQLFVSLPLLLATCRPGRPPTWRLPKPRWRPAPWTGAAAFN